MSDPQHLGLGELGQRLQAMGDPAPQPVPDAASTQGGGTIPTSTPIATSGMDSWLRPYQGAPLPVGPISASVPASGSGNGYVADTVAASAPSQPLNTTGRAGSYPAKSFEGFQPFAANASGSGSGLGSTPAFPSAPKSQAVSAWEPVSSASSPRASSEAQLNEPNPLESIAYGQPPKPANAAGGSQAGLSSGDSLSSGEPKSGLHRALNAISSTIPFVQRLLPLLEGSLGNALGALIAPQPPAPPPVQIDMEPVERGLAEVRNSNRELRTQVQEQGTTLKRVEDQLERVREATDRNTLEQQELVEDLRAVGSRISTFAIIGVVLLVLSLGLNIYFLIELQHILR